MSFGTKYRIELKKLYLVCEENICGLYSAIKMKRTKEHLNNFRRVL